MYTVELLCPECYAGFDAAATSPEAVWALECTYCGGVLEEVMALGDGTTVAAPDELPPSGVHLEVRSAPVRAE